MSVLPLHRISEVEKGKNLVFVYTLKLLSYNEMGFLNSPFSYHPYFPLDY